MNDSKVIDTPAKVERAKFKPVRLEPSDYRDIGLQATVVVDAFLKIFVMSFVAGVIVVAGPLITDAPGVIARYLASFCAAGRPCDFGTLYRAFGVASFLVLAVPLFFVNVVQHAADLNGIDDDENVTDLIYEDIVRAAKKDAKGLTAERLAFTTGLDRIVVRDALLCLQEDNKIFRATAVPGPYSPSRYLPATP